MIGHPGRKRKQASNGLVAGRIDRDTWFLAPSGMGRISRARVLDPAGKRIQPT